MRLIVAHLLDELLTHALRPMHHSVLGLFDDILLHDGSSSPSMMRWRMSSRGGITTISPAAVELHSTMSCGAINPFVLAISPDTPASEQYLPEPSALKVN